MADSAERGARDNRQSKWSGVLFTWVKGFKRNKGWTLLTSMFNPFRKVGRGMVAGKAVQRRRKGLTINNLGGLNDGLQA